MHSIIYFLDSWKWRRLQSFANSHRSLQAVKECYELFESVLKFFGNKSDLLRDNLSNFKNDIACLTDLYNKINEMNLQLQREDLNLIKTKSIISVFVSKLVLYKTNLGRREVYQFPNLFSVKTNDADILTYWQHFQAQRKFYNSISRYCRYGDSQLGPWFFLKHTIRIPLQEKLIELSTNEDMKLKFTKTGYQEF